MFVISTRDRNRVNQDFCTVCECRYFFTANELFGRYIFSLSLFFLNYNWFIFDSLQKCILLILPCDRQCSIRLRPNGCDRLFYTKKKISPWNACEYNCTPKLIDCKFSVFPPVVLFVNFFTDLEASYSFHENLPYRHQSIDKITFIVQYAYGHVCMCVSNSFVAPHMRLRQIFQWHAFIWLAKHMVYLFVSSIYV